eukprot:7389337-Prymnesium_polylepis.2
MSAGSSSRVATARPGSPCSSLGTKTCCVATLQSSAHLRNARVQRSDESPSVLFGAPGWCVTEPFGTPGWCVTLGECLESGASGSAAPAILVLDAADVLVQDRDVPLRRHHQHAAGSQHAKALVQVPGYAALVPLLVHVRHAVQQALVEDGVEAAALKLHARRVVQLPRHAVAVAFLGG